MRTLLQSRAEASSWEPDCAACFERFRNGQFDEDAQIQLLLASESLLADFDTGELVIGYAGVDGIYFCLLKNQPGVWANYGIDDEHVSVAESVDEFVSKWQAQQIVL